MTAPVTIDNTELTSTKRQWDNPADDDTEDRPAVDGSSPNGEEDFQWEEGAGTWGNPYDFRNTPLT